MSVESLRAELMDQSLDMPRRFRALFALRSVGGDASVSALLDSLRDPSALFKHEVAFALGQMQATGAVETLKAMLRDESEHSMVRHEAAEALGAIASDECLEALETASEDSSQVVRETAVLALQRFRYAQAKRRDAQAKNARADAKAPSSPPSARPDERAGSAKEQLSASTNGHQHESRRARLAVHLRRSRAGGAERRPDARSAHDAAGRVGELVGSIRRYVRAAQPRRPL
jgi:deoxyhypusine monooxygenase